MREATIGDRLRRARRARFVGRSAELELLRAALAAAEPPWSVLWVHGIGGVGKTALLGAFEELARGAGAPVTRLDLGGIEPSPAALAAALGTPPRERHVLLLDAHQARSPVDGWLRARFLPGLPAEALTVIASRDRPGDGWLDDPGWRELLRVVELRNLSPADARAYLAGVGVASGLHDGVIALTHGHPLALVLQADVLAHAPGSEAARSLDAVPDLVARLLPRLVDRVPSARHRRALEACAYARYTTEGTLRAALGGTDAAQLHAWLRALPFVADGARGLYPHDLVRDVLASDLRRRDPEGGAALRRRVHDHALARLRAAPTADQQLAADVVFLHRGNRFAGRYWDWESFGRAYVDALRAGDRAHLTAIAARHEGTESARLVARWADRQPGGFLVFRADGERPIGFAALLALHAASPDDLDADAGARAMWDFARHRDPAGEVLALRFLFDERAYQDPSPSLNLVTVGHLLDMVRNPRTGWELIGPWADAERIAPMMSYIEFHRAPAADFTIAGRSYGVFAHDWRRMGLERWLDVMSARWTAHEFTPLAVDVSAPEPALSQPEFAAAVRAALRDLHRPDRLAANPLLRSRLVRARPGAAPGPAVLQEVVEEAVGVLRGDPRDEKLHRALARTYLRPAPTQEAAAEVLGLPFSTYRRHLTRGIERVTGVLWQRELEGTVGGW